MPGRKQHIVQEKSDEYEYNEFEVGGAGKAETEAFSSSVSSSSLKRKNALCRTCSTWIGTTWVRIM
jgi:hypothetical protein